MNNKLTDAAPDLLAACKFGKDSLAIIEGPELLIQCAETLEKHGVNYLASLLRKKAALENKAIAKAEGGRL